MTSSTMYYPIENVNMGSIMAVWLLSPLTNRRQPLDPLAQSRDLSKGMSQHKGREAEIDGHHHGHASRSSRTEWNHYLPISRWFWQ